VVSQRREQSQRALGIVAIVPRFATALFLLLTPSKQRALSFAPIGPGYLGLLLATPTMCGCGKARHGLFELCEATKHTRRVPRCHTSWRDVLGDDAACTDYGAAADPDAGKNDYL
jgi:hypothetical protein